jgi:hypothetical protein
MIQENNPTLTGDGIGGVYPDTRTSLILAQGDYIINAVACRLIVRHFGFGFNDAFLLAAGFSLSEGLVFSGVLTGVILSPAWSWAPVVFAYYAMAYATFIALPLLLIAPGALWRDALSGPFRLPTLILGGFAVAFTIRVVWGLVYGPLAERAFDLPPNLPGV